MTILVTGSRGTIGRYFAELHDRFKEPLDLTDVDSLDVTNLSSVRERFDKQRYSAVVHLAAETDVDRCEREPEHAFRLNVLGTWNIALAAREFAAEMVQVSTIGIFGANGSKGPFSELDPPDPATVYAKTKVAGEERVRDLVERSYVVRTTWIMGGRELDRKFVGKFRQQLVAGNNINAVDDRVGSLTYARDFVLAIAAILETKAYGLYHMTNAGWTSPYQIACVMKGILDSRSEVKPISADAFPHDAPRPKSEASLSLALPARGMAHLIRPWEDALRDYLRSW